MTKPLSVGVFLFATLLAVSFVFADHNININTADKDALMSLSGIGEVKAQAIIDYRSTNGPFAKKEDIMNVSGIGPATYNTIKDHITVEGGTSSVSPPPAAPSPAPSTSPSPSPQGGSASAVALTVEAGADRTVIVGADAQFSVRAYDASKKIIEQASFSWNFGDGSTGLGSALSHRYEYPGHYAVVVSGSSGGVSATDRFTVTAETADLSFFVLPDGSVEIKNLSSRDADLSHWIVQSAGERFILPDNSLVLADQTARISPQTLHFYAGGGAELEYPSGALAFRAGEHTAVPPPASPPSLLSSGDTPSPAPTKTSKAENSPDTFAQERASHTPVNGRAEEAVAESATSSQLAAVAESAGGSWTWWLAAGAIALGAGATTLIARRAGKKEWNLIEDGESSV